jgi:hypothetical protein
MSQVQDFKECLAGHVDNLGVRRDLLGGRGAAQGPKPAHRRAANRLPNHRK